MENTIDDKYVYNNKNRINIGDIITFGNYPRNRKNKKEPIQWQVLEIYNDCALIVSQYTITRQNYNEESEDTSWERCTLRQWLNTIFFNDAFTNQEQDVIQVSKVRADDNLKYNTPQGNDTEDKIFLLSLKEAGMYFNTNTDRSCKPTRFAINSGVQKYKNGNCYWWLRSIGYSCDRATVVDDDGELDYFGDNVLWSSYYGVRPALWINYRLLLGLEECENQKNVKKIKEFNKEQYILNLKDNIIVGDIVTFGKYPKNVDAEKSLISWRVLSIVNGNALIITQQGIDSKQFNDEILGKTWNECSLRKWLNNDFFKMAFNAQEKNLFSYQTSLLTSI